MIDLQHIAFRIALGQVDADEIQSTVDALLADGVYSDEFVVIMDSKPPRLADVLPPFRAYLESEGISIPSKDNGVWESIAYHVSRIVSGEVDPLAELQILISEVYWTCDFHSVTKEFLGDSHGIHHLIGLYWTYDDLKDGSGRVSKRERKRLNQDILKRSKEWMERFANKALHCTAESRADAASSIQ